MNDIDCFLMNEFMANNRIAFNAKPMIASESDRRMNGTSVTTRVETASNENTSSFIVRNEHQHATSVVFSEPWFRCWSVYRNAGPMMTTALWACEVGAASMILWVIVVEYRQLFLRWMNNTFVSDPDQLNSYHLLVRITSRTEPLFIVLRGLDFRTTLKIGPVLIRPLTIRTTWNIT